jgi:hypothetical protein
MSACDFEGCGRRAVACGLCDLHRKQTTRSPNLARGSGCPGHPRSRLIAAALLVADAPAADDAAYRLVLRQLERAALSYARARGLS